MNGLNRGALIGVGTDIIETRRFDHIAERAPAGVAGRLFTRAELSVGGPMTAQYLASRFAAKEAVMKSLGSGMDRIAFTDIEVFHDGSGRPCVKLSGGAREWASAQGIGKVLISISHSHDFVCAFAVSLGGEPDEIGHS